MAISRRLRFEILRRDSHTCRYCGGESPVVALTVDHVVPVALGGTDDPENLVAACKDCNAGKSSIAPDSPIVAAVSDASMRWADAMRQAAAIQRADQDRMQAVYDAFYEAWEGTYTLPNDWRSSVARFIEAGADIELLYECIDIAFAARGVDWRWKYFCGVTWRRIKERQQIAAEIYEANE